MLRNKKWHRWLLYNCQTDNFKALDLVNNKLGMSIHDESTLFSNGQPLDVWATYFSMGQNFRRVELRFVRICVNNRVNWDNWLTVNELIRIDPDGRHF